MFQQARYTQAWSIVGLPIQNLGGHIPYGPIDRKLFCVKDVSSHELLTRVGIALAKEINQLFMWIRRFRDERHAQLGRNCERTLNRVESTQNPLHQLVARQFDEVVVELEINLGGPVGLPAITKLSEPLGQLL